MTSHATEMGARAVPRWPFWVLSVLSLLCCGELIVICYPAPPVAKGCVRDLETVPC